MNTHRILLSILVLLPWLESKAAFTEGALPLGVLFVSPDGQYSVQLEEIDRAPHFLIKTMATGQVDNSIVMPTRLLYLHWAANSKSFVTVEHIAKGSRGRVIYLEADKWRNVTGVPPLEAK